MTAYGYARVSTEDQNPALQLDALKRAACEKTYIDRKSGASFASRPALARCLKALQPGDVLTVWKLDRLGRSVREVLNPLHELDARKVRFVSLTEAIDTKTPTGRAMLHMVALLAELERGLIHERTKAGIELARRRGVKFGRPSKLAAAQVDHARREIEAGRSSVPEMAELFGVDRVTLWRRLKVA